jgi:hypothetical protein
MQPTIEINIEDWIWDSPMEEDLEEDGLPPMQHQALAHRPLPLIPDSQPEIDDWVEPLTVIPESEDAYDEPVRI